MYCLSIRFLAYYPLKSRGWYYQFYHCFLCKIRKMANLFTETKKNHSFSQIHKFDYKQSLKMKKNCWKFSYVIIVKLIVRIKQNPFRSDLKRPIFLLLNAHIRHWNCVPLLVCFKSNRNLLCLYIFVQSTWKWWRGYFKRNSWQFFICLWGSRQRNKYFLEIY